MKWQYTFKSIQVIQKENERKTYIFDTNMAYICTYMYIGMFNPAVHVRPYIRERI
jgi:hypothetical protein